MQITAYQYADPAEICALGEDEFGQLLRDKIYSINPQFESNQLCMARLISHVNKFQISRSKLKLIRNLIKHFQIPILFCLRDFYQLNKEQLQNLALEKYEDQSQKSANSHIKLLEEIKSIYLQLIKGQEEIQELKCFSKYVTGEKNLNIIKTEEQYQEKYLIWLKKTLVSFKVLKQSSLDQKNRILWKQKIQKQFEDLVINRPSCWLEKFTINQILKSFQNFHHSNSVSVKLPKQNFEILKDKIQPPKKQIQSQNQISPYQRRYFFENENLSHAQDVNLEYKNFRYPYDKYCVIKLRRAICGFLNRAGGVILVGIHEDVDDKCRIVKGQILSEYRKQQILTEFKYICQQIQPDIIAQAKYHIKFVPIKQKDGKYIQGKYVVRVQVAKGEDKYFYTIREDSIDYVVLRTANQVLRREITQQTLKKYKMRLLDPPRHPVMSACPQPQIGIPLLQDISKTRKNDKINNDREWNQYEEVQNAYNTIQNRRKQWRLKTQPISPPTSQIKRKDFVYFNSKKTEQDFQLVQNKDKFKKRRFICDEEEDLQSKQSQIHQIQSAKSLSRYYKDQYDQQNNNQENQKDEQLDFKPLNPVKQKVFQFKQPSKQYFQPFVKEQSQKTQKEIQTKLQPYKIDRTSLNQHQDRTPSLDLLIIGLQVDFIKLAARNSALILLEDPIKCSRDDVLWVKIINKDSDIFYKLNHFKQIIVQKKLQIQSTNKKDAKKIKVRKLFPNLHFNDQILLNKLIHKFSKNEYFCDANNIIYFSCKDYFEAIQAHLIALQLDIKTKFISDEQLKSKKLQYLRQKCEERSKDYRTERQGFRRPNRLDRTFDQY